jgi:hypothetical protein
MTEISTDPAYWHVGLVGYGEVGRILAEGEEAYNPLIIPASISSRLKRRASAPFLQP